jgi:hypothetical protein
MRWLASVALAAALTAHPAALASDQLADARRFYNLGQYDAAEKLARAELATPSNADAARVVLGRVQLERYRQSADPNDLAAARESLRNVDPLALDARAQVEYTVGLGEALYLEDRFGAAAQLFESVLTRSSVLGPAAHERVLDWWATALDRYAQTRPAEERDPAYDAILSRMRDEIVQFPGSTAAGYWLAAAARGRGDLERAWQAALAGWVRAGLAEDRGAELRADLDRLVVQALLPERAAKLGKLADAKQAFAVMLTEWEAFKTAWSK